MPRLNVQERAEVRVALAPLVDELDEIHKFLENAGPKSIARKVERALELLDRVIEEVTD